MEECEKAQNNDDVVQVGDDGGDRILPFEAKRQIDHDAEHHHAQRLEAVLRKFFTDLRANKFGAAQCDAGISGLQSREDFVALLGCADAFLRWQTNHHVT